MSFCNFGNAEMSSEQWQHAQLGAGQQPRRVTAEPAHRINLTTQLAGLLTQLR